MNRLFKTVHTILVILFLFVNLYLLAFNWSVFTVSLNLNYGFGVLNVPPFIFTMIFNFIIIGIIWFTGYTKDLRSENSLLKKEDEIHRLKESKGSVSNDSSLIEMQKQLSELTELIKSQKEETTEE